MMKKICQAPIRFYQKVISPLLPRSCRYHPTCSCFTMHAIEKHGAMKGIILGTFRILRCHPFSRCSFHDPVPERFTLWSALGYKRETPDEQEQKATKP